VDSNNSIYISERTKKSSHANRLTKFEVNSIIRRVIAATDAYVSGIKQFNSPRTIFVDSKGILYVVDIDNWRIHRFIPGNRIGTTVISAEGLTNFIIDQEGNFILTIKPENILITIQAKSMNNTKKMLSNFLINQHDFTLVLMIRFIYFIKAMKLYKNIKLGVTFSKFMRNK